MTRRVVDFRLDEGELELQQTVARWCSDRFPLDAVGVREAAPVDRSAWTALADMGVFGMLLAESEGGIGLTAVDAAIVFEQVGSHLVSGPVLWTLLAAPFLAGARSGEQLVGGVDSRHVEGGSVVVEYADEIDVVLVVGDEGVVAHHTRDLPSPTSIDALDPLSRMGRITGLASGEHVGGRAEAEQLRTFGALLTSAMLSGISARSLDVARNYALQRHQFGAPIGSFQAVKHMLADMYLRSVSAQSAMYAAAAVVQHAGGDDPLRAVAGAKLLAADAAILNAGAAVQVLGGMGFTWHMLPNYLLKRAWALENDFGTIEEHEHFLGSTLSMIAT
jgi:alkylation response protein AidB-like acyl-CoA dehydrogenase